jgi:hypothetical protein
MHAMALVNAVHIAWAAGFLDGEGCIHITRQTYGGKRRETMRLGVHITQNDLPSLEHFREAVGIDAPIYPVKMADNHRRQCYTLNYSGHAAMRLLNLLMPYLKRKRAVAEAAEDFWTLGRVGERNGARGLDPEVIRVREHYFHLLKQLK